MTTIETPVISSAAMYAASGMAATLLAVLKPESSLLRKRLRFRSTHGVSGLVSTALTCLAIVSKQAQPRNELLASMCSIMAATASVVTASSGMKVVNHAPKEDIIMKMPFPVTALHRVAFKETALSIYYICGRIMMANGLMGDSNRPGAHAIKDWIFGVLCICYVGRYSTPRARDIEWKNGHTYLIVLPTAVGLAVDALFQLPILQCQREICWNRDIIGQLDLLYLLLLTLVLALAFTLTFRGVLGVRQCYWGSVLALHGIVVYISVRMLPLLT